MEWISVKDRLPELKANDYLVCDDSGTCTVAEFNKHGNWEVFSEYWEADEITHWMTLPKPPTK